MAESVIKPYDPKEEKFNIISHGIGILFSIVAFLMMINVALGKDIVYLVASSVYGFSLITLYSASTFYHSAKKLSLRKKLKVFDHAAIYVLIAGTYTPFLLITLRGIWGYTLLAVVWGTALIGVVFKIFYAGKFKLASTVAYVLMGLIIVVAINPLKQNLAPEGLTLLWVGGAFYIIGAVFYVLDKIPANHAIFHTWVLAGSVAHFISVYNYVLK